MPFRKRQFLAIHFLKVQRKLFLKKFSLQGLKGTAFPSDGVPLPAAPKKSQKITSTT